MKCSKCNFESEQDFAFCPQCGEKASETTYTAESASPPAEKNEVDAFVKNLISDKKRLSTFILGLITALTAFISITEFNFSAIMSLALYSFLIYGIVGALYASGILKKTAYESEIVLGGISLVFFAFVIRFIQLGIAHSWESFIVYILKSLILLIVLNGIISGKGKSKAAVIGSIFLAAYEILTFAASGNAFFTGFIWKLFRISEASLLISLIFIPSMLSKNADKFKPYVAKIPKLKTAVIILLLPIAVSAAVGAVKQLNSEKVGTPASENKIDTSSKVTGSKKEEPKDLAQAVNLGDTISLDFTEMFLESASFGDELKPTDTSGVYSYYQDEADKKYFYLTGTIKNIGGHNYGVDNICVELNFDDTYKYNGRLIADDGGNDFYGDNVDPLDSVKFYMYSSIPDELINSYEKCTVTFGFDDNFGYNSDNTYSYTSNMNECKHIYKVALTK